MATATITAGNTYIDVSHGLGYTPDAKDILINPLDDLGGRSWWLSNVGATTFRINIGTADLSDHQFSYNLPVPSPTGTEYCTKQQVKDYSKITYRDMGLASDSAFDTFLDALIVFVSRMIDDYCDVPDAFFGSGGVTKTNELYDYNQDWIQLKYHPVVTFTKLEYNTQGYGLTPSWTEITSPDYILKSDEGLIMLVEDVPAIKEQSVRATYTAGYSTLPSTINWITLQVCANALQIILQRRIDPKEQVDPSTIRLVVPEAFTQELKLQLNPYKRRFCSVG